MAIEKEAPEEVGAVMRYNLFESAVSDQTSDSLSISLPPELVLTNTEHKGSRKPPMALLHRTIFLSLQEPQNQCSSSTLLVLFPRSILCSLALIMQLASKYRALLDAKLHL